jgi:hypothetical protein
MHREGHVVKHPLTVDELRVWCERLVQQLAVPMPLDPYVLCQQLARHRGRPIKIRTVDLGGTTTIGHLLAKRRSDLIICDAAAPTPQRTLIICHEVVHLIRHDVDSGVSLTCGERIGIAASSAGSAGSMYSDWWEWEAETGARILAAMADRRPRPDQPVRTGRAELSLAAAFGLRI